VSPIAASVAPAAGADYLLSMHQRPPALWARKQGAGANLRLIETTGRCCSPHWLLRWQWATWAPRLRRACHSGDLQLW